jgi:hypothetical protein
MIMTEPADLDAHDALMTDAEEDAPAPAASGESAAAKDDGARPSRMTSGSMTP